MATGSHLDLLGAGHIDNAWGCSVAHYITNPQVIHETIDGETIIIDLENGTYFSLQGSAPVIWEALAAGRSDAEIIAQLEVEYAADSSELRPAVASFVEQLVGEQLIASSPNGRAEVVPSSAAPAGQKPFVAPTLERYTDMQDIILLDPVHKVDSAGWPHAASAATA